MPLPMTVPGAIRPSPASSRRRRPAPSTSPRPRGTRAEVARARRRRRAAAWPGQVDVAATAARRSRRRARCRSGPGRSARSGTPEQPDRAPQGAGDHGARAVDVDVGLGTAQTLPERAASSRRRGADDRDARARPRRCGRHVAFLSWRDTAQPRGRRRRALPREDGGRAGRARLPGHRLLRRARRRRRPTRSSTACASSAGGSKLVGLPRGHAGTWLPRPASAASTSWSTSRTACRSSRRLVTRAPGRRAGAPRAPRAVAGRLPRAAGPGRLVDRAPARAPALPALPVRRRLPRHPRRAARRSASRGPRVAVVHNGTDPVVPVDPGKAATPRRASSAGWCRTSRSSTRSTRCSRCGRSSPACACTSSAAAGGRPSCTRYAAARGAGDTVGLRGPRRRGRASTRSTSARGCWPLPSLKEGWGLVVGEAGMHATPTVAYRSAGGTRESIADGAPACSWTTASDFTDAMRGAAARRRDGAASSATGALQRSHDFTWPHAQQAVRRGGRRGAAGRAVDSQDPDELEDVLHVRGPRSQTRVPEGYAGSARVWARSQLSVP